MVQRFIFIMLIVVVNAFSQSTEASNPFNSLMGPQSSINLLSGTVAFDHPITTINAGGKVSLPISLAYSSNLSRTAQARNDRMPTGWVGLGWSLGYSHIRCDVGGTTESWDDKCYFITATGLSQKIIAHNGTLYLEKDPYWKVVRNANYSFTQNWVLTDPQGVIYEFGDSPNDNSSQATAYTLSWAHLATGLVGAGLAGSVGQNNEPRQYAIQWNLRKISDKFENSISLQYQQYLEPLAYKKWKSTVGYTKEIYLKSIQSSNNLRVEFELGRKGLKDYAGEYRDPRGDGESDAVAWITGAEPNYTGKKYDPFIDPYETRYLSSISIKSTRSKNSKLLSKLDFCYRAIEPTKESGYVKRVLEKIVETDAHAGLVGQDEFEYFDSKPGTSSSQPFGYLKSMKGRNCGTVAFHYETKTIDSEIKNQKIVFPESIKKVEAPGANGQWLVSGQLENGTEYFIAENASGFWIYGWYSGKWRPMPINIGTTSENLAFKGTARSQGTFHNYGRYFIAGGGDWFLEVNKEKIANDEAYEDYNVYRWKWNGRNWEKSKAINVDWICQGSPSFAIGDNFLAVGGVQIQNESDEYFRVDTYVFANEQVYSETTFKERKHNNASFQAAGNHLLVYYSPDATLINAHAYKILTLRGLEVETNAYGYGVTVPRWVTTKSVKDISSQNTYVLTRDYLAEIDGYWSYTLSAYSWNGTGWTKTLGNTDLPGTEVRGDDATLLMGAGQDYFVLRYDDKDEMRVYDWNGIKWTKALDKNLVNFDADFFAEGAWQINNGNEYFVARSPEYDKVYSDICILKSFWGRCLVKLPKVLVYATHYGAAQFSVFQRRDGEWTTEMWMNSMGNPKTEGKIVLAGQDWWGSYKGSSSRKIHVFNGEEWNEETNAVVPSLIDNAQTLGGRFFYKMDGEKTIFIYRKINDNFTSNFDVPFVTGKEVYDPVTNKTTQWTYTYNGLKVSESRQATFDGPNNTPMVPSAIVNLPDGNGSLAVDYCDALESSGGVLDLERRGMVCKQTAKDRHGNVVQVEQTTYSTLRETDWPSGMVRILPTKTVSTFKGVAKTVETSYAMDVNGMPRVVKSSGSGKPVIKKTLYAWEVPAYKGAFQAFNMRTDVAQVAEMVGTNANDNSKIRSAMATWYLNIQAPYKKPPLPLFAYRWDSPNYKQGLASGGFDFSNFSSNTTWTQQERFDFDNAYGILLQTTDVLGRANHAIYDASRQVVVAKVTNAGLRNATVLTGQYPQTEWTMGNATFATLTGHGIDGSQTGVNRGRFAPEAVLVSSSGPSSTVYAEGKRDYVMRAWVLPSMAKGLTFSAFGVTHEFSDLTPGQWQRVEWKIPAALATGNGSVSLNASNGNSVFLQDLRVHPVDASVATTYYDVALQLPITTVDANGIGAYARLDDRGRTVESYGENEDGTIVQNSATTYVYNGCVLQSYAGGSVASVRIGDETIAIEDGVKDYDLETLPGNTEEIGVQVTLKNSSQKVRFGVGTSSGSVQWENPNCCGASNKFETDFTGDELELYVQAEPFGNTDNILSFHLARQSTGWRFRGAALTSGLGKVLGFPSFAQKGYVASFDGTRYNAEQVRYFNAVSALWEETAMGDEGLDGQPMAADFAQSGGQYYLAKTQTVTDVPRTLLQNNGTVSKSMLFDEEHLVVKRLDMTSVPSTWQQIGGEVSSSPVEEVSLAVHPKTKRPWVAYVAAAAWEEGNALVKEKRLYVKRWNGSQWEAVGDFSNDDTGAGWDHVSDGRVSKGTASSPSLAFTEDGIPYVAYLAGLVIPADADVPKAYSLRSVFVKRLYTAQELNQSGRLPAEFWAGHTLVRSMGADQQFLSPERWQPSIEGDVLAVNAPEKVILRMDNTTPVIAVSYLPPVTIQEQSGTAIGSLDRVAVSVYRGNKVAVADENISSMLEWNPVQDQSVSASAVKGLELEEIRSHVCYTLSSEPFDFQVQGGVPYVLFADEGNGHKLTAVRFDAVKKRWLSVGNPNFMSGVPNASIKVAFDGTGEAQVALTVPKGAKEVQSSRQGNVSAMHYVGGGRNLTLSAIDFHGSSNELQAKFRQYYTQYSADLATGKKTLSLTPTPLVATDVLAIAVSVNGKWKKAWSSSPSSLKNRTIRKLAHSGAIPRFDLDLPAGENSVVVRMIGVDNTTLEYSFTVLAPSDPVTISVSDAYVQNTGTNVWTVSPVQTDVCPTEICVEYSSGWRAFADKLLYGRAKCIAWDCINPQTMTLIGPDGKEQTVVLQPGYLDPSAPVLVKLELSDFTLSPAFDPNSHDYQVVIQGDTTATFTLAVPPGTQVTVNGVDASDGEIVVDLKGGSVIEIVVTGANGEKTVYTITVKDSSQTGEVADYGDLAQYTLFTRGDLRLSDRVVIEGSVGSVGNVALGVESRIAGDLVAGGTIQQADRSSVSGSVVRNSPQIDFSLPSFTVGNQDYVLNSEDTKSLVPGNYGALTLNSRSTLYLSTGTYTFASLNVNSWSTVSFACMDGPVKIYVKDAVNLGDHSTLLRDCADVPGNFWLFVQNGGVNLGPDNLFRMRVVAPDASVTVGSRVEFHGSIWARQINVEPDSKLAH